MTDWSEIFDYRDGKLYRKTGKLVNNKSGVYERVSHDNCRHYSHRVIYEMHHGPIPKHLEIDHIDGDKRNNKIENLRAVSHKANLENIKKAKGFTLHKKTQKFQVRIKSDGKSIHIGYFDNPVDAHIAYLKAKEKHHISTTGEVVL